MSKISAIIQARMSSTRLPGKVLKELYGINVLEHVVNRVISAKQIDNVIVATTNLDVDLAIINECQKIGVDYFVGDSDNVLQRYYEAARYFNAQTIIRITSDCPCISPNIISQMIESYLIKQPDYLSNTIQRSFPRGLDVEMFSFVALEQAYKNATKEYEKEHVTPYIYQNPDKFKIESFHSEIDNIKYRWTLDTEEDWQLIEKIYSYLYKNNYIFEYEDILDLFVRYPDLIKINQHVEQKKLGS